MYTLFRCMTSCKRRPQPVSTPPHAAPVASKRTGGPFQRTLYTTSIAGCGRPLATILPRRLPHRRHVPRRRNHR